MEKLSEIASKYNTCAIAGHVNPDGDCVGSVMALYNYLKKAVPGLAVKAYLEPIPEAFVSFTAGADEIRNSAAGDEAPELFFALDCGDLNRVAVAKDLMAKAKVCVCIDHHISNKGFGDINCIRPDKSSTSEILYELMEEDLGVNSKEVATLLYLGIMQDTGVFQYPLTGKRTMEIGGKLMSFGIEFSEIVEETFFSKSYTQNLLLGKALTKSRLLLDGKLIVSRLTGEDMEELNAGPGDTEGIVSQLRNTRGTMAAVFAYYASDGRYKISLRSKGKLNVSSIAEAFGGGGHVNAAGFHTSKDIDMIFDRIVALVKEQLDEMTND